MTKPFSVAFKQKMVQRLTGKDSVSASQLARETGVRQQNLSRWVQEARSLPIMAARPKRLVRDWSVEQKARIVAAVARLNGEELSAYLEREGVKLAEYEQWRLVSSLTDINGITAGFRHASRCSGKGPNS